MLGFVYVAIGGAIGAVFRYLVSIISLKYLATTFPWGTLIVNLLGSFVIGFLWGLFELSTISQNTRLFLFMGILGSFTTFSSFSLESFNLLRSGEYWFFFLNIILNVVLGIGLVFIAYFFSRYLLNYLR